MDERNLPEPIVREGEIEEKIPEAAQEEMSSDDILNWSQEWNDDAEELFPLMQDTEEKIPEPPHHAVSPALEERDVPATTPPEKESGERIPNAPTLWMQPYELQQEEVKAQEAQMSEVVAAMFPAADKEREANEASLDFAMLHADEISRIEELAWGDDLERGSELGIGDE